MRRAIVLGLLACAAAISPAFAAGGGATVYVPLAAPAAGEVAYKTFILVSNTGEVERRFTATFLPGGGGAPLIHAGAVPAKATYVLTNVVPAGARGLLAVSGAPQLAVTARLEARSGSDRLLSGAALPVIAASHLLPAGGTAHLQGLERSGRMVAGLGIVNPGESDALCAVVAYRADGGRIADPVEVAVAPLSQRRIADPLSAGRITDARVEVSCNAPFYAYSDLLARDGSRTGFAAPSAQLRELANLQGELGLGDDDDGPPGDGDGHGGGNGGGTGGGGTGGGNGGGNGGGGTGGGGGNGGGGNGEPVPTDPTGLNFEIPGLFFQPRNGDSYKQIVLPLEKDVRYRAVTVEFDLHVNRWQTPLFHNITALRRTNRTLYYGLIVRADKARTLLDLGRDKQVKEFGPWRERTDYRVRMVYDGGNKKVTFQLFDPVGVMIHQVSGKATTSDLRPVDNKVVKIDFGSVKVGAGAYFPPVGWLYSNLKVQIVK